MLVTLPTGEILDANQAFIRAMGYTEHELIGTAGKGGTTWMQLSVQDQDLEADLIAAQRLADGADTQYWVRKHYQPKGSAPQPVLIHVQRYPETGELLACLVTCHFLVVQQDQNLLTALVGVERNLIAAMEIRTQAIMEGTLLPSETLALSLVRVFMRYPKASLMTLLIFGGLIFGDRLIVAVQVAMSLLLPSAPAP